MLSAQIEHDSRKKIPLTKEKLESEKSSEALEAV